MTSAQVGSGAGAGGAGGTTAGGPTGTAGGTGTAVGGPDVGVAVWAGGTRGASRTAGGAGAAGAGAASPFQFWNTNSNNLRLASSPVSAISFRHWSFETGFPFRIRSVPARRTSWR